MAVLQVFQAKMLANEEASLGSASLRDLRSATDLALRATKATAQAIGRSMSSLIVLEHHLWLTMTEMKEADCGEGGVVQRSLQREKDSGDSGK